MFDMGEFYKMSDVCSNPGDTNPDKIKVLNQYLKPEILTKDEEDELRKLEHEDFIDKATNKNVTDFSFITDLDLKFKIEFAFKRWRSTVYDLKKSNSTKTNEELINKMIGIINNQLYDPAISGGGNLTRKRLVENRFNKSRKSHV
jgi:hypothetical protein